MLNHSFPDTIYAIQHVAFEDLGSFEDIFYQLGFRVRYFEAGIDDLTKAYQYEGLTIILGGPIGVYETTDYPFLQNEIDLLKVRLENDLPTIGICLGAQLIASALGAKVYSGNHKEIGWTKINLADVENNPLSPLENIEVLHWHGDTFDLPQNATLLASSNYYQNQAFLFKKNVLALQFHIEAIADSMEKWLIGHTHELRNAKINIPELREDNKKCAPQLQTKAADVLTQFLKKFIIK